MSMAQDSKIPKMDWMTSPGVPGSLNFQFFLEIKLYAHCMGQFFQGDFSYNRVMTFGLVMIPETNRKSP